MTSMRLIPSFLKLTWINDKDGTTSRTMGIPKWFLGNWAVWIFTKDLHWQGFSPMTVTKLRKSLPTTIGHFLPWNWVSVRSLFVGPLSVRPWIGFSCCSCSCCDDWSEFQLCPIIHFRCFTDPQNHCLLHVWWCLEHVWWCLAAEWMSRKSKISTFFKSGEISVR